MPARYYPGGKLTRYKTTAEVTLFDSRCGMRVEWGDARAGNYGNFENCENYGKMLGASLYSRLGLPGLQWRGVDSITLAASPRAIKQP